ncbi:MAG: PilW family protein [Vulcanimicrobiota bacterium]
MRQKAFTLPELLITMALVSVIGLVLTVVYNQSYTSYDHGSTRVNIQTKGRQAMERLTPVVLSAFPGSGQTIYVPDSNGTTASELVVSTTEDWLEPAYPSPTTSALSATGLGDITYHTYRVVLRNGDLLLERVIANGSNWDTDPNLAPRSLAHTDRQTTLVEFEVTRESTNALRVRLLMRGKTRGANRQERDIEHDLETILHVPHESLRVSN